MIGAVLKQFVDAVQMVVTKDTMTEQILDSLKATKKDFVSRRFSTGSAVCARLKAFQRLESFDLDFSSPDSQTQLLFAGGHSIHDVFQQKILPKSFSSWGHWRCSCCGAEEKYSFKPPPCEGTRTAKYSVFDEPIEETCQHVRATWQYEEIYLKESPFNDPLYEISGYLDHVIIKDDKWFIVEIKSVGTNIFSEVYETKHPDNTDWRIKKPGGMGLPKDPHIKQAQVYGVLLSKLIERGEIPAPAPEFGGCYILYIDRDSFAMRDYHLTAEPGFYRDLVDLIHNTKSAVDAGNALLAMPLCSSRSSWAAKGCPKRDVCFPTKGRKK